MPNPRSSHAAPVPRIGGIGIVCGFYVVLVGVVSLKAFGLGVPPFAVQDLVLFVIVGAGTAALGLYDDVRGLKPGLKFSFQVFLALLAVVLGIRLETLSLPLGEPVEFGFWVVLLTVVWLTGFSNIYNFMDGINGLAGGSGVVYGGFLGLFAWWEDSPELAVVAVLLAGGCLGFLFHNFPRSQTFMGDVGSLFLGMLFALLVVRLAQNSSTPATLTALLLVCSVYLYDSGFTVLRRLRHGENIFRAHRSHLYQRMVQAGLTHGAVTSVYLGLHILVGFLAFAYLSASQGGRLGILGLVLTVFLVLTLGVGWLERRAARKAA